MKIMLLAMALVSTPAMGSMLIPFWSYVEDCDSTDKRGGFIYIDMDGTGNLVCKKIKSNVPGSDGFIRSIKIGGTCMDVGNTGNVQDICSTFTDE